MQGRRAIIVAESLADGCWRYCPLPDDLTTFLAFLVETVGLVDAVRFFLIGVIGFLLDSTVVMFTYKTVKSLKSKSKF